MEETLEEWRSVPWASHIQVSNKGNARSLGYTSTVTDGRYPNRRNKPYTHKLGVDVYGYPQINFKSNEGIRTSYKIHRLVALLFLSSYSETLQVNHKNGIKTDNRVENLEMVTSQENLLHKHRVLGIKGSNSGKFNGAKSIPILQIDPDTLEVIEEFPSYSEIKRRLGVDHATVRRCVRHKEGKRIKLMFELKSHYESVIKPQLNQKQYEVRQDFTQSQKEKDFGQNFLQSDRSV